MRVPCSHLGTELTGRPAASSSIVPYLCTFGHALGSHSFQKTMFGHHWGSGERVTNTEDVFVVTMSQMEVVLVITGAHRYTRICRLRVFSFLKESPIVVIAVIETLVIPLIITLLVAFFPFFVELMLYEKTSQQTCTGP